MNVETSYLVPVPAGDEGVVGRAVAQVRVQAHVAHLEKSRE